MVSDSEASRSALVRVERGGDKVAVVTLERPKANALSLELLDALANTFRELHREPPGAVVVTGAGRGFSAGAEISELSGPEAARAIGEAFASVTALMESLPRIVVAAIEGWALGGGLELALACDLRVASETAKLGQPEIALGIIPGGGGTQRLARLIGPSRALDLICSGRQLSGADAWPLGLVDRLAPPGGALELARSLAASFASGAVVAQGLAKRAVRRGLDQPLAGGLAEELEAFVEVFGTEDAKIGIGSFLSSGPGKARFVGR
jgi:enoyl-CoA hydratase/carnithine racemase